MVTGNSETGPSMDMTLELRDARSLTRESQLSVTAEAGL